MADCYCHWLFPSWTFLPCSLSWILANQNEGLCPSWTFSPCSLSWILANQSVSLRHILHRRRITVGSGGKLWLRTMCPWCPQGAGSSLARLGCSPCCRCPRAPPTSCRRSLEWACPFLPRTKVDPPAGLVVLVALRIAAVKCCFWPTMTLHWLDECKFWLPCA